MLHLLVEAHEQRAVVADDARTDRVRHLLARDDAWYLPTHGPAIRDPRPLVEAYRDHRRERSEQILAVLDEGPATITEIVPRLYADVSKRLWQGAGASVWAHVLALAAEGAIAPDGGPLTRQARLRRAG